MSVRVHTEYTYELDDHTFPLPFDPEGDAEFTWVSDDGKRAILAFLVHDESPADPFEEFDEGDFYQFDARYKHYSARPDLEEWKRIIRGAPGRVFTHNGTGDWHGPGTTNCFPDPAPLTPADCRGRRGTHGEDCRAAELLDDAGGYYIVPEDATDPAQYAKGAIEQYSAWCNGDVYGVIVWTYERADVADPWDDPDRDECWGFYGYDYASGELKEQFDAAVKG